MLYTLSRRQWAGFDRPESVHYAIMMISRNSPALKVRQLGGEGNIRYSMELPTTNFPIKKATGCQPLEMART